MGIEGLGMKILIASQNAHKIDEIKPVLDGDRLTGHETSVVYGVFMHSVERRRAGYTGILAGDTHERTVVNGTVEDVITALQWLVGKTS